MTSQATAGEGPRKAMEARHDGRGGAFSMAERNAQQRGAALDSEEGLFDYDAPPPVSLHDKFGMPPFSILDRRSGHWQDRKRKWLSLGIRSELGRDGGLIASEDTGFVQGGLPLEQRSDRALEATAKGQTDMAKRAQRLLEARQSGWRGKTADGRTLAVGAKWDEKGTPQRLIPGAGGVGGAYDRSRPEGTLNRQSGGKGSSLQRAMTDRPNSHGGTSSAEGAAERRRLNDAGAHRDQHLLNEITGQETLSGTSIFDPVLCELVYRWFTASGMRVLDPFAGGSVRGIVAGLLERHYMGIDLRGVQIEANKEQGQTIIRDDKWMPRWVPGDSLAVLDNAPPESMDLVFSCPPYADLEVYSDDPRDISNMTYDEFTRVHAEIIRKACATLRQDRFAAWVISDVRDKRGHYRGLVHDTVRAFEAAGLHFYNEAVVLDPVGSAAVRSGRIFLGGRKLTRMHQLCLVFVKGDWKRATTAVGLQDLVLDPARAEVEG